MDSLLKAVPFTNCYIDDILVAFKGTIEELEATVQRILETLDKDNIVKWGGGELHFFQKEIDWLGYNISEAGGRPFIGKTDAIKNLPFTKNICELRSFVGSINQNNIFVPNLSLFSSPLRPLLNKRSVYQWDISHSTAFRKL